MVQSRLVQLQAACRECRRDCTEGRGDDGLPLPSRSSLWPGAPSLRVEFPQATGHGSARADKIGVSRAFSHLPELLRATVASGPEVASAILEDLGGSVAEAWDAGWRPAGEPRSGQGVGESGRSRRPEARPHRGAISAPENDPSPGGNPAPAWPGGGSRRAETRSPGRSQMPAGGGWFRAFRGVVQEGGIEQLWKGSL